MFIVPPFNPGDRIQCTEYGESFTGVYVGPLGKAYLIEAYPRLGGLLVRDDGEYGDGPNGEWVFSYDGDNLECSYTLLEPAHTISTSPAPHIMGLSEEVIDFDAYREFMKGL